MFKTYFCSENSESCVVLAKLIRAPQFQSNSITLKIHMTLKVKNGYNNIKKNFFKGRFERLYQKGSFKNNIKI